MKTAIRTTTTTISTATVDVNGESVELELSNKPSPIMDYKEMFVSLSPNKNYIVLAYLVADSECESPLTWDGQGKIFEARRHGQKEDHRAMQAALALDADWQPNLDLVDDNEIEHWKSQRASGVIGDPLAVPLDVYEHGGIMYTVSGSGPQDDFDTARGGALWIPDACARENIVYKAIQKLMPVGTCVAYESTHTLNSITYTLPDGSKKGDFPNFVDAIKAAAAALDVTLNDADILRESRAEARVFAASTANEYTMWRNGEAYGYVIEAFIKNDDDSWELLPDDDKSVYGYIGDTYALEQMSADAQTLANFYASENERTFVQCDESCLDLLRSYGASISDYDHARGGVTATLSQDAEEQLQEFAADFKIITTDLPQEHSSAPIEATTPTARNDDTPSP